MKPLRIGTRGSALALWQANHLRDALAKSFGIESEIVTVKTSGDKFAGALQVVQLGFGDGRPALGAPNDRRLATVSQALAV